MPTSLYPDSGDAEDFAKEHFEYLYTPLDEDNGEPEWDHITCAYQDTIPVLEPED